MDSTVSSEAVIPYPSLLNELQEADSGSVHYPNSCHLAFDWRHQQDVREWKEREVRVFFPCSHLALVLYFLCLYFSTLAVHYNYLDSF